MEPLATYLYTGLEEEEEILCTVHSSPRAIVSWRKDGKSLDDSSADFVFGQEANKHSLTVKNIKSEYLGRYTCEAKNELGSDQSSVELSGKAEPVVFSSSDISLYPDSYTLSWRADSKSEITMFLVEYKESRATKWTSMEVTPSQGQEWRGTTLLSHLQSATQYQARVSSRNMFGYSHPAMLNFATKGAGTVIN